MDTPVAYEADNVCVAQLKMFFRASESPPDLCAPGALPYIQGMSVRSTERAGILQRHAAPVPHAPRPRVFLSTQFERSFVSPAHTELSR
jgi:hypothetical protein